MGEELCLHINILPHRLNNQIGRARCRLQIG